METAVKEKEAIDAAQLMEQYKATGSIVQRNQLVLHYSYIAKVVAAQMRGYTANFAQMEDIVNQGMLTLIDVIEKFDTDRGVKFESYAFTRIKNANIDFIRQQDWLPRRVRKTAKDIATAFDSLSNELMHEPTVKELAAYMAVPEEAINKHYSEISNSVMISLETVLQNTLQESGGMDFSADDDRQPEEKLARDELHSKLVSAIDALSERERTVISLYYYEHLRLYEIAEVMGVSESRVCQLHSKAVSRMKLSMEAYMKG
ncbi:MAG: FliA/WhiG family RNA polymerase sigma factor [Angelakisella sp.]